MGENVDESRDKRRGALVNMTAEEIQTTEDEERDSSHFLEQKPIDLNNTVKKSIFIISLVSWFPIHHIILNVGAM